MFNHKCNICQESYSRKWNLKRHIHDVHGIEIDNTHNSNSEIEKYPNHSYSNSKILPKMILNIIYIIKIHIGEIITLEILIILCIITMSIFLPFPGILLINKKKG